MTNLDNKSANALAKLIAKESDNVRVKFGTTNGRKCLHVIAPGNGSEESGTIGSTTIYTPGQWEVHPANKRFVRNNNEAAIQATEKTMSQNSGTTEAAA